MYGVGLPELLVITLVVALLFGAPILTFFMGYVVGKNRAATTSAGAAAEPVPPSTPEPSPEEPADE